MILLDFREQFILCEPIIQLFVNASYNSSLYLRSYDEKKKKKALRNSIGLGDTFLLRTNDGRISEYTSCHLKYFTREIVQVREQNLALLLQHREK